MYPIFITFIALASNFLHRHTNKGEESRVFVPTAGIVNNKTTRRYIKTYAKMLGSDKAIMVTRLIGMVGLPIICILFNITYFVIGMSG